MDAGALLRDARAHAGLTSQELANSSATTRTAISAYENGRKSPTVDTLRRLLASTGHDLTLVPTPTWREVPGPRGFTYFVPSQLPQLSPHRATRTITLPKHVAWSGQRRTLNLADRADRIRAYRAVMTEGTPEDMLGILDASLLIDAWPDLLLPRDLAPHWRHLIEREDTAIG
ncbi:helix-turn-helix domain-containing protein [Populibacterium corticicola]|uniref:Helix-turn-helix domain-containing protein n=1 Tax=Populibacterium corticicola TaxID=1812826 RepID=A0ABW5XCR3_9MICO